VLTSGSGLKVLEMDSIDILSHLLGIKTRTNYGVVEHAEFCLKTWLLNQSVSNNNIESNFIKLLNCERDILKSVVD